MKITYNNRWLSSYYTFFVFFLLLSLSVLLISCGGGGGEGEAPPSPPTSSSVRKVAQFTEITSLNTGGSSRGIMAAGDIIFVAEGESGISIVASSGNNSLNKISTISLAAGEVASDLGIAGNYLFVAARAGGLKVYDVADPTHPSLVTSIGTPDLATSLTIDGNLLYLCDRLDFQIYDISTPAQPTLKGSIVGSSYYFMQCLVHNQVAYVAGYWNGLLAVDVSNPVLPAVTQVRGTGFAALSLAKQGNHVIVGGESRDIKIYNIADNGMPLIASLPLVAYDSARTVNESSYRILIVDNHAFIAAGSNGSIAVNLEDILAPYVAGAFASDGITRDIAINDSTLYSANLSLGIRVLNFQILNDKDGDGYPDIQDAFPNDPTEWLDTDSDGIGNNVDPDDDNDGALDTVDDFPLDPNEWLDSDGDGIGDNADAFPHDPLEWLDTDGDGIGNNADLDDDGDRVPDYRDEFPLSPAPLISLAAMPTYHTADEARDSLVDGNFVYVAEGDAGLAVYQINGDNTLQPAGGLALPSGGNAKTLCKIGNDLFLAAEDGGLLAVDVTDPESPQLNANDITFAIQTLFVDNDILWAGTTNGLLAFDISDPTNPALIGQLALSFTPRSIVISNGYAYLAAGVDGLVWVDVSDPANPSLAGSIDVGYSTNSIVVHKNHLLMVGNGSGLLVYSIKNSASPTFANEFPLQPGSAVGDPAPPFTVSVKNDYALVTLGDNGIELVDVSSPNVPLPYGKITTSESCLTATMDNAHLIISLGPLGLKLADVSALPDLRFRGKWTITKITDNSVFDGSPKIDHGDIAWYGGIRQDIYFRKGTTGEVRNLTDDLTGVYNGGPSLSDGQVAWRSWDKQQTNSIFFWDGSEKRIIHQYPIGNFDPATGYPPSYNSQEVSLDYGTIAWAEWDGQDYEIMFWDGNDITQITDNDVDDYEPQLSNGQISWTTAASDETGTVDVMFWDGNAIVNISNSLNTAEDSNLRNGEIVWTEWSPGAISPSPLQFDIFHWDGIHMQKFSIHGSDFEPEIDPGSFTTWTNVASSNNDSDVYVADNDGLVFNITHDPANSQSDASVSGNQIVFRGRDVGDSSYDAEIFLATFTHEGDLTPFLVHQDVDGDGNTE